MDLLPAAAFRRTDAERADQRLAWARADRAFFAAGACHVLAWACRRLHPGRGVGLIGLRRPGAAEVSHVVATRDGWALDHSGWHPASEVVRVNQEADGPLDVVVLDPDLARFCREHRHRPPPDFAHDPWPRARCYVRRFDPPWASGSG
ncbi:hypothetical protein GCM10023340_42330 [Nocardioides marinquilinus]|uniref:Uncharacterized protein n=1 Tax=Nocardioides marinquilinus TaxID=1210400 RepID=A0ABP9Q2F3_9ACTN